MSGKNHGAGTFSSQRGSFKRFERTLFKKLSLHTGRRSSNMIVWLAAIACVCFRRSYTIS
ncbi:hypothetical protein HZS_6259 [Henneguya salminicola]|nr:hypothetical protein HZS_6259 [Henneguya salminicola]